jgi:hypothetical protein
MEKAELFGTEIGKIRAGYQQAVNSIVPQAVLIAYPKHAVCFHPRGSHSAPNLSPGSINVSLPTLCYGGARTYPGPAWPAYLIGVPCMKLRLIEVLNPGLCYKHSEREPVLPQVARACHSVRFIPRPRQRWKQQSSEDCDDRNQHQQFNQGKCQGAPGYGSHSHATVEPHAWTTECRSSTNATALPPCACQFHPSHKHAARPDGFRRVCAVLESLDICQCFVKPQRDSQPENGVVDLSQFVSDLWADVAELADALDSKSGIRKDVWVRPPPSAPTSTLPHCYSSGS